jgi:hypothetical protein
MKRHINKRESPPCPTEEEKVCEYFREMWDPPKQVFFKAEQDSPFHLNKKLPDKDVPEDMMEYILSEDNIRAVIRSRDDLNACGNDGISYRIMKAAKPEAVKFMKRIIKATIQYGRVFECSSVRVFECSTHGKQLGQFSFTRRENEPIRRTGGQSQSSTAHIEYTRA